MAEPPRIAATCATPGCDAPRDLGLSARLVVALPLLRVALGVFGFLRVYRLLSRASAPGAGAARGASRSPRRIAAVVVHVNRHVLPYGGRCLLESMVLWYLLRRAGHPAEIRLGARTLLGPLEAHAWVELDGEVLNDTERVRDIYSPFDLSAIRLR
jgi:hypothetical protein